MQERNAYYIGTIVGCLFVVATLFVLLFYVVIAILTGQKLSFDYRVGFFFEEPYYLLPYMIPWPRIFGYRIWPLWPIIMVLYLAW